VTGVYAIFLTGTKFVYVGHGKDVESRWKRHAVNWVEPNDAEYVFVRDMPNSDRKARQRTESALMRLLRSRGYWMLSRSTEEHASLSGFLSSRIRAEEGKRAYWAAMTPEERKARIAKAQAAQTVEMRREAGRKGGAASVRAYTPEERSKRLTGRIVTPETRAKLRQIALQREACRRQAS
jgi:hypothetical protein